MPAYNAAHFIEEAIDSVLSQHYTSLELIVVDDASTDNTAAIVSKQKSKHRGIILEKHQGNQGIAAARNQATELATGKYIAFLDSDDMWLPNKLQRQVDFMQLTGASVSCTSYIASYPSGRQKVVRAKPSTTYSRLLRGNTIGNLTGMYDVDLVGKLYQKPKPHEDYIMWLEVAKQGAEIAGMSDVLATYRVREQSVSASKARAALWVWSIYRDELKMSLPKRCSAFACYFWNALTKRFG
jgi:teichuronic acid biosynthesis glycosyltransferase TuaG